MKDIEGQIIIFGKEGHAEVQGLIGQTNDKAIVIASFDDLIKIDFSKPIYIYSQTTKSPKLYKEITNEISRRIPNHLKVNYIVHDTLCRQVSQENPLKEFSNQNDVIIFVSGKKVLMEKCYSVL